MASKAKYVKVTIQSDAKSLAGYTVLGDVVGADGRQLVLERPEQAAATAPRKKPAVKKHASQPPVSAAGNKSTSFDTGALAPVDVGPSI